MIRLIRYFSVLLLAVGTVTLADGPAQPPADISQAELLAAVENGSPDLVILDVRTPEEYAEGHVPGARNLPVDRVADSLSSLESSRSGDVVVYCRSGKRAAMAIDVLRNAGFARVRHLDGDMLGWASGGLPIETGGN